MPEKTKLRHAATVILVRQSERAAFELLMLKRSPRSAFMPEVFVYPGGALDELDCEPSDAELIEGLSPEQARRQLGELNLDAHRALGLYFAAAREVFEESGLLLAHRRGEAHALDLIASPQRRARFAAARRALCRGELSLSALLRREGLLLSMHEVGYFARWITPRGETRRYDARFFVIRAPRHQRALPDAEEVVAHRWGSPSEMLSLYGRGDIALAPPTFSTLKRLERFDSIEALFKALRDYRPMAMLPFMTPGSDPSSASARMLLPHHPDYPESYRDTELRALRAHEARDVPPWRAIRRGERGWEVED